MKKFIVLIIFILIICAVSLPSNAVNISKNKDITIKNRLFSITLPNEFKDYFSIRKTKDCISIYHKESQKAGFGGFAFAIKAYKTPAEHANLPGGKKIGELTDKNGKLYDIVLKYPTDVQYDYTKSVNAPESYKKLYDYGELVDINGIKGSTYYKNKGTKGEDLYKDILQKHITAINEKWDSDKLEKENMSYMYNVLLQNNKRVIEKIGYTYYDTNADGIEELLIGEISQGAWQGIIYDMYTMVNRKPAHVMSGGSRNRFFICDNTFICNEYSNGANENGVNIYILEENTTDLFPQVSFKYDGYANPQKPWFISYGNQITEDSWQNVTEKFFNERKKIFEQYVRFNYIPLSRIR